jgi:biopolymer transport protein ExbD
MGAKLSGGSSHKGKRFDLGQNSDINVTPFVDVMLVLLIIFMVAAPMATVSIKVDLPPAEPPPPNAPKPKDPVFINVEQNQRLYIGPKETSLANLIPDITAALDSPNPTEERVMIRANKFVPYRDFMAVLNQLQGNGFLKIGLISEDL